MSARMLVGIYFMKKRLIFCFIEFPGGAGLTLFLKKNCGGGEWSEDIVVWKVARMVFLLLLFIHISLALKLK